jgi:hypothetical protein
MPIPQSIDTDLNTADSIAAIQYRAVFAAAVALKSRAINANRVQGTTNAGQTVAAGGTAVSATITPSLTGKVRVSVSVAGSIDAPINILLEKVAGGTTKVVSWPTTSSGSWVSMSFVFEVDGLALNTPVTFNAVTTLGDGNLTIGNGTDGIGAAMLLEELQ